MRRLTVFAFLMGIAVLSDASPTINTVVITETGLEIQGAGFGDENPMLFWDDVSSGFEDGGFSSGDLMEVGESKKWRRNTTSAGWPITYLSVDDSRSGRSGVVYHGEGRKAFVEQPVHDVPSVLENQMLVSWWYKPSLSPSEQGGANKFIRIWDDTNGKGTRISWTQMHLVCLNASEDVSELVNWGDWGGQVGQWNHMMVWLNLSEDRIKAWTNGQLVHDAECRKDPNKTGSPMFVGLIGFDNGSGSYQDMITEMDDFYIGSSRARVEISSSSEWSPMMEKEILPISDWSDESIKTGLSDGTITLSDDMYVYVVDEGGAVNSQGVRPECLACPKLE